MQPQPPPFTNQPNPISTLPTPNSDSQPNPTQPSHQVVAHMMPDLPNVGWERDLESFREFFENPAFRTDGLKVGRGAG